MVNALPRSLSQVLTYGRLSANNLLLSQPSIHEVSESHPPVMLCKRGLDSGTLLYNMVCFYSIELHDTNEKRLLVPRMTQIRSRV